MLYLSRLILNPSSKGVKRELHQPYEMHRTVMRAFKEMNTKEIGRVLHRLDLPRTLEGLPTLYIQSHVKPDWSFLNEWEGYLAQVGRLHGNPATRTFDPSFAEGKQFCFRLRANPTIRKEGKRVALVGDKDQIAWLNRQGKRCGFEVGISGLRITREGQSSMGKIKRSDSETHRPMIYGIQFDGILRVTDSDCFSDAVASGIGHAKAFGFGLLSLAASR